MKTIGVCINNGTRVDNSCALPFILSSETGEREGGAEQALISPLKGAESREVRDDLRPLHRGERTFALDKCHVTIYISILIKTFADRHTKELYETGKSKRLPPAIWKRALRKLEYLDLATALNDLKVPLSNRLHELERERKGELSISINDQWRICFRFIDGDTYDVEITNYH